MLRRADGRVAEEHYDRVTDAWRYVLGSNFHYGLFEGSEGLEEATDRLTDEMASRAPLSADSYLLDVGCGTGGPAIRLQRRFGCRVLGISVSSRGVALAREAARREGVEDRVRFERRDALGTGLRSGTFDVAWLQESSHLAPDKAALVAEMYRLLASPGVLLLCDLILKRGLELVEIYHRREELDLLDRVFGAVKASTPEHYRTLLESAGFVQVEIEDVSPRCRPTLGHWKKNLRANRDRLASHLTRGEIDRFEKACDIVERMFDEEILGYVILKAVKSG